MSLYPATLWTGLKNKKAEIENKLKMCKKDLDMIYAPQVELTAKFMN